MAPLTSLRVPTGRRLPRGRPGSTRRRARRGAPHGWLAAKLTRPPRILRRCGASGSAAVEDAAGHEAAGNLGGVEETEGQAQSGGGEVTVAEAVGIRE
eukprot:scaffold10393_cov114-Isochrysis_galbana.AAC.10